MSIPFVLFTNITTFVIGENEITRIIIELDLCGVEHMCSWDEINTPLFFLAYMCRPYIY